MGKIYSGRVRACVLRYRASPGRCFEVLGESGEVFWGTRRVRTGVLGVPGESRVTNPIIVLKLGFSSVWEIHFRNKFFDNQQCNYSFKGL